MRYKLTWIVRGPKKLPVTITTMVDEDKDGEGLKKKYWNLPRRKLGWNLEVLKFSMTSTGMQTGK